MIAAIVTFKADLQFYNKSRRSVVGPEVTLTGHAALADGGNRCTTD